MTMTTYPQPVADRLSKLDSALAECAALRAHAERELDRIARQEEVTKIARDMLLEIVGIYSGEILADRLQTRETMLVTMPAPNGGLTATQAAQVAVQAEQDAGRHRRDIRGEVLNLLTAETDKALTPDQIAKRLDTLKAGVERALAYHQGHGRVTQALPDQWVIVGRQVVPAQMPIASPSPMPAFTPPPPQETPAPAAEPTGKTREQTIAALERAGTMGLGPSQIAIMAISDDILDALIAEGLAEETEQNRVRLLSLPEPFNPLADLNTNASPEEYDGQPAESDNRND